MIRSVAAILGGFLLAVVMAFGLEFVLIVLFHREPVNDFDREPVLLLMLLLTTNASAAMGGYLAGWIAIRRPVVHALILGALSLLAAIPATAASWKTEPAWYYVCALVFLLPATGAGGWWYARQRAVA